MGSKMAKKRKKITGIGGARPGAGRPKVADKGLVVSVRVPKSQLKRLDAYCKRNKVTRPQAVRDALAAFLDG